MPRLVLFTIFFCCIANNAVSANQAVNIFVSVPPQKYLVDRIGQEHVRVHVMLMPGYTPETFDPTPRQLMALASTQFYFRMGLPFETVWMDVIKKGNSQLKVIECCEYIPEQYSVELDNHVWTSPRNALLFAGKVMTQLINHDPAHKDDYERNYRSLAFDLKELDDEIHALLSQRRTPYFIMSHASLGHYAQDYGLIQLSLEKNGRELGIKRLSEVVAIARQENIHTLFVQKQYKTASASAFAKEIGAKLVEVDPLQADYISNLRELTNLIAKAAN